MKRFAQDHTHDISTKLQPDSLGISTLTGHLAPPETASGPMVST